MKEGGLNVKQRILALCIFTLIAPLVLAWHAVGSEEKKTETTSEAVAVSEEKAAETLSENVASVDGVAIPRVELESEIKHLQQLSAQGGQGMMAPNDATLQDKALDNLIERELLYQKSVKEGIQVDETAVQEQIESIKKRFPTAEEYQVALGGMSLTEPILQKNISKGLVIQQFVEKEIMPKVIISDADTQKFYDENPQYFKRPEQIKAAHILVKVEEGADEAKKTAAMEKIKMVQEKIKAGEDFATLAKEHSEGPSGPKGGDLGQFGRGQMVKPFEDAAFALNNGEVSEIVTTRFGYHIIMVEEKVEASTVPLDEAKPDIDNFLKKQKTEAEIRSYVEGLKETADIKKM
jgi:peptidyl-prolyl cis-trans isomerase C